ncbi:hypothetical protein SAMN04487974_10181 [Pelagibacterium luteolum]|uniref:Uncharacterized protein n=1 Tax=Pelagibacterium luteolum TaxID=440168 RepID=A0A1G7RRG4_9HYPH|nr:hypothetical protein SAMN04487974_10181 [Pelagibacterium luteolum]
MLIQHSPPVILHRMARIEARSLEAGPVLIAKYQAEQMIAQAIEAHDPQASQVGPSHLVDTRA